MTTVLKWFTNLFKLKSPCCKATMIQNELHINKNYSEILIYECSKCNKKYI